MGYFQLVERRDEVGHNLTLSLCLVDELERQSVSEYFSAGSVIFFPNSSISKLMTV